jgi:hypothetical protein
MWATRLRWRLRGASQWPAFVVFTLLDGALLNELPIAGDGPGGIVPGVLLAGFGNLFLLAVAAPVAGRVMRRRRADLPVPVASDFAATALIAAGALVLLASGLVHRPVVVEERADRVAQYAAVSDYVRSQAPGFRDGLAIADSIRLSDDLYRTCVPGDDPRRPLCLFVETDQHPPGVTRDPDLTPNAAYR